MKTCADCLELKDYSEFPPFKRNKDGYYSYCRVCHRKKGRAYKERRKPVTTVQNRVRQLLRYGLTQAGFDALLNTQGGLCAICKGPEPKHINWNIDHCHVTGRIRGILCRPCNLGLGHFQDNPVLLVAAVEYLHV